MVCGAWVGRVSRLMASHRRPLAAAWQTNRGCGILACSEIAHRQDMANFSTEIDTHSMDTELRLASILENSILFICPPWLQLYF